MSTSATVTIPQNSDEQLYQEALAISPLFKFLDISIVWVVTKIFSASKDKRVKRGGHLFLAHLLRFSVLTQLSLFPGTEICDVAKISIPNILQFCKNRSQNGWPWCYDTTLKYFNLLVAAGVLIVRKREPGIYYLPLGPCVLLPDHARRQIAELSTRRMKVSRSAAFRRTANHCLVSTLPERAEASLGTDDQDARQAALAINAVLQRQQGVTLLPTTLAEVICILAEYAPRVLQKGSGTFPALSAPSTLQSRIDSDADPAQQTLPDQLGQKHVIADQYLLQEQQNLLVSGYVQPGGEQESTNLSESQPHDSNMVDSDDSHLTESVLSLKETLLLSEKSEFTINGQRRKQRVAESTDPALPVDSAATDASHKVSDLSEDEIRYWAAWLSDYINHNGSKIGHYTTYLRQSPVILHIAIVDALVRSVFPDPHKNPARLGGGWVTNRYKAYRAGEEIPAEIYAWSQTGLSYQEMTTLLEQGAHRQDSLLLPRRRPFPDEVQGVIASEELRDFWRERAACGLIESGYSYVDVDGELFTPEQYQLFRQRSLETLLGTDPRVVYVDYQEMQREADPRELQPETEYELLTYFEWHHSLLYSPVVRRYSPEELEFLLEPMPPTLISTLQTQVEHLEAVLDPSCYKVEVVLLPIKRGTPIKRGPVIVVRQKEDPAGEAWLLTSEHEVETFISDWLQERCHVGGHSENSVNEMDLPTALTEGNDRGHGQSRPGQVMDAARSERTV